MLGCCRRRRFLMCKSKSSDQQNRTLGKQCWPHCCNCQYKPSVLGLMDIRLRDHSTAHCPPLSIACYLRQVLELRRRSFLLNNPMLDLKHLPDIHMCRLVLLGVFSTLILILIACEEARGGREVLLAVGLSDEGGGHRAEDFG